MNDPAFNLAQVAIHPDWYDHLPQVEAAMAECARVERLRYAAGWTADEGGWYSPDGVSEHGWADEGWPFPEDADFANWFRAARRPKPPSLRKQAYDALDTYIYGEPDPKDKERTYNTIRRALESLND